MTHFPVNLFKAQVHLRALKYIPRPVQICWWGESRWPSLFRLLTSVGVLGALLIGVVDLGRTEDCKVQCLYSTSLLSPLRESWCPGWVGRAGSLGDTAHGPSLLSHLSSQPTLHSVSHEPFSKPEASSEVNLHMPAADFYLCRALLHSLSVSGFVLCDWLAWPVWVASARRWTDASRRKLLSPGVLEVPSPRLKCLRFSLFVLYDHPSYRKLTRCGYPCSPITCFFFFLLTELNVVK